MCQMLDRAGERQGRQREGQQHGGGLRGDHHAVAAVAVGHDAARRRQQEDRDLAGEADRAQQHRGAGEPVDQPGLRHVLHPRADQRDELAAEEELEVAVLKRAQRVREGHTEAITRMLPIIASGERAKF